MTETLKAVAAPVAWWRRVALERVAAAAGATVSVAAGVAALFLHVRYASIWPADLDPFWRSAVVWALTVAPLGALLAWRRGDNPVGWLVLACGLLLALSELGFAWTVVALADPGAGLPWHPGVIWVAGWLWSPGFVMLPTLVLLLAPEGRLPSRGWRVAVAVDLAAIALAAVGFALAPYDRVDPPVLWMGLENPLGVPGAERVLPFGLGLLAVGVGASVASVAARLRHGSARERQQLKWVLLGASLTAAVGACGFVTTGQVAAWVAALAVLPLIACTTVAVLRHRLWDVEAFIARSAVYALLTLLVAAAYLAIVGLVGARVGRGGGIVLALLIVGVGLQPARTAVQRQVNRLLYGQRDDPYEVLAALGHRLEGAAGTDPGGEALPGVARTVAEALRLPYIGVAVDGELLSSSGVRPDVVESVPLAHRDGQVGVLEVGVRRGETTLSAEDRRVLTDLARHLAGAASAVRLTRDLLESRQAIVTAREEERRRLHRDLHDDLGPALAALVLQLETAADLVERDPAGARALLARLGRSARDAVDVTRRIVTDLRPPPLDELGIVAALQELGERFSSGPLHVSVEVDDPGPLPAAVEVVLLRVASEALTNTVRHSGARSALLRLRRCDAGLTLEVVDDGIGVAPRPAARGVGLQSIHDRVAELGGESVVEAATGGGTRLAVTVPVGP